MTARGDGWRWKESRFLKRTWTRIVVLALLLSIGCDPCAVGAADLENGEAGSGILSPLPHQTSLSNGASGKVTVVSIPYFSFMELDPGGLNAYPGFRELASSGDWAAMNVRLPFKGMESVYAVWGTGQVVDARGAEAWNRSEHREGQTAAAMLERYAGRPNDEKSAAAVIVPSIESIRRKQEGIHGMAVPGQLGRRLKQEGIRIAVWGTLDLPGSGKERTRRPAPLMVMDEQGTVEHGAVGSVVLSPDRSMPFGMATRYGWLIDQWKLELERSSTGMLALIELGDLYRLYREKGDYQPDAFLRLKNDIVARIDRFLVDLMKEMKGKAGSGVLWVISPQAHPEAMGEKLMLTPAVRWSPASSAAAGGMLSSATTQRPGMIAAVDIAPSILREFGVPVPPTMTGMPAEFGNRLEKEAHSSTLERLVHDVQLKAKVYRLRPPLLYGLACFEVVSMVFGLWVVWRTGRSIRLIAVTQGLLSCILLLPALLLVMGWLVHWNAAGLIAFLFMGMLLGGAIVSLYATTSVRLIRTLWWIGAGVALLLLFDGMTGAQAMKSSVLGYDVMIGARYYGIGNEFMGVLLGAAVLALSAGLQARAERAGRLAPPLRRWRTLAPAAAAGVGIAGYLAAPALGTNAGGALSAAAAFGALTARLGAGGALGWRRLALALALPMAAALAGLWLLNAAWPPGTAGGPSSAAAASAAAAGAHGGAIHGHGSHIGRAFETLRQGRYDAIGAMIARKLAMNLHLIRVSAWSKVLLTGLAVMAVLVLRPRGRLRRWGEQYPYLMHGVYANVIGVFAALALNDSGIVAAAAMIVYSSVPLLMLTITIPPNLPYQGRPQASEASLLRKL